MDQPAEVTGAPEVIDVHAHVFPQNVLDKIWRYFDAHHWPIYYRSAEAERTAVLEARAARYTTLCYAHRPGMAAWLNDYALDYARQHPQAIATGTFHPEDPDAVDYVRAGIERGLRGFKLHLEVQRFDPADPRLGPVYGLLADSGSVLHVHTAGAPLEGPWTGPAHFERLLALAPKVTVVVAHLGAGDFERYLALADRHPLYFDTAMVGVDYPGFGALPDAFQRRVREGAERYLFGSDFPNIPYPWEHQLDVVRSWGLSAADERRVLCDNARRLYRLT